MCLRFAGLINIAFILKPEPGVPDGIEGSTWQERADAAFRLQQRRFARGSRQFIDLELAREKAAFTRWKTIEHLDKYLIEFESNFIRSGGRVVWAQDVSDALEAIHEILQKAGVREAVKSKSNTIQEIGLPEFLQSRGITCTETDTGDFVMDAAGEAGSHMVLPAIHKSSGEIAALLSKEAPLPLDADAEGIVHYLRSHLRGAFLKAGAGITGCNFLVADPGAIVILENEGNAQLTASVPKIHIVVAGIEKMLPTLGDLDLFLPLLGTYGTGQLLTTYNHIITGPRQPEESDGPEELYVILLDNGRTDVLAHNQQRQAMSCIRCGACQMACPSYREAGPTAFPSPVSAVTLPLQHKDQTGLTQLSSICGACKDVCPVKIDIPRLLLENRRHFVEKGLAPRSEKWFYFAWKKAMLKRELLSWTGINPRRHVLENLFRSREGLRSLPVEGKEKTFNEWYREKMNIG